MRAVSKESSISRLAAKSVNCLTASSKKKTMSFIFNLREKEVGTYLQ